MSIIIKGGTIVTENNIYQADILIEHNIISKIGKSIEGRKCQVYDANDCYVFPGAIDPHTHFDLNIGSTKTNDDFFTGTRAAIVGGTTTIIDFATPIKGEHLQAGLKRWHQKARAKSYTDYSFHMALSEYNDHIESDLEYMVKNEGVTSFKFYLAYKDVLQVNDGELYQAMLKLSSLGATVCLHCENGDIIAKLQYAEKSLGNYEPIYHALTRPQFTESEAISRAINIAKAATVSLYLVHVSTKEGVRLILEAKKAGQKIYAETCPQYLLLDDSLYSKDFSSAKYVMSPPLRKGEDIKALWIGLREGIIDTVGSDHCSFNLKGQKELGIADFTKIPNGVPGVQDRFGLLYTYGVYGGNLNLNDFVKITATNAAKIFGLFPRKGSLTIGSHADIVVWDSKPRKIISAKNHLQNVDYNLYEGYEQIGECRYVFLRGQKVVENGKLWADNKTGRFMRRNIY